MPNPISSARSQPHLQVQMEHRLGALRGDVEFALTQPWTILFGPSGCGKTTILRALAEILRAKKVRLLLAAPTGRAAQRLAETTEVLCRLIRRNGRRQRDTHLIQSKVRALRRHGNSTDRHPAPIP